MQHNSLYTAFAACAIATTVVFPKMGTEINAFAEPIGIVAMKTNDPKVSFAGFVIGHDTEIANLPNAQGFNSVTELQMAFKHFMIVSNAQIIVGEHGYGIKRLVDSMLGNQIIDLEFRQNLEVLDLVGKLQSGNPPWNSLDAYISSHELNIVRSVSVFNGVNRIASVYSHNLDRLNAMGVSPTTANMMPYKKSAMAA